MKKYLFFSLITFLGLFLLVLSPVTAQTNSKMDIGNSPSQAVVESETHGESIEGVLSEILATQQINTIQQLDCTQVSDAQLEHLGDAVMEQQHPGIAHQAMDRMMGGEGSDSLRVMHTNMGSAYLGCGGSNSGQSMMGGLLSNSNLNNQSQGGTMMGLGSMMGLGGGVIGGFGIFAGLTWIALISFLLAGAYFFLKQANKK